MIDKLLTFQQQYAGLEAWPIFISKYTADNEFRRLVYSLSKYFLQTTLSNCNSCYFDAYIQLILLKKENAMKSEECLFGLRAGALLYGENNDLNMTNVNTTNELALYHIKRDPRCLKFFHKVPANLDELLAAMDAQVEPPFTEDDVLQEFAEKEFINMLAESIKEGADDATIAVAVSDQKLVGKKSLTKKALATYLAAAHKLVSAE